MNNAINVNMEGVKLGSGLMRYSQVVKVNGKDLELYLDGLSDTPEDRKKCASLIESAYDWVFANLQEIKQYLARRLDVRLNAMRKNKRNHNVPPENEKDILKKLENAFPDKIHYFYYSDDIDTISVTFLLELNDNTYSTRVGVKEFQCNWADIFIPKGVFQPSPKEAKPDINDAPAFYQYHIDHGNVDDLYKSYALLPEEQIEAFIDLWINDDTHEQDDKENLLLYLALFSYNCGEKLPDRLYDYLLAEEIFYYEEFYLRAPEKYAHELISKLAEVDDPEKYRTVVNHILSALSRMPSQEVNDFLLENSKTPLPVWAEKLYILPVEYAKEVGCWEAANNGGPRMLYDSDIISFKRVKKEETDEIAPLKAIPAKCGFCGQPLTLIFNKDLPQATCMNCSCYQTIYTKVKDKKIVWHPKNKAGDSFNKHPEYMQCDQSPSDDIAYGLAPAEETRKSSYTANQFANISHTQLGGLPTAINDINIPICPDCGKPMKYVGQLDMDDLQDDEGIYYFFECSTCRTTASNYDQS